MDVFGVVDVKITGFVSIWTTLTKLPRIEVLWSVVIGIIVGVGYVAYFYVTVEGVVPASTAIAFTFCNAPTAVLGSVFLFGEFYVSLFVQLYLQLKFK